jgi:uncharacterized protein YbaA (DUF1428 family)
MAKYVDGFLLVVSKKKLPAYRRLARKCAKVWRRLGALEYRECVGDDMKAPFGVPFPRVKKCGPNEVVVFSWIVYNSRAHRDRVNAKVMKDPAMAAMCDIANAPFDMKRLSYGGFRVLVDA